MSKVSTPPKTLSVRDAYIDYADRVILANPNYTFRRSSNITKGTIFTENGTFYMDYKEYKNILSLYYIKAGVSIIKGYAFNLNAGLGNIFLMRQGRDPSVKPKLNRGESFKIKKELDMKGVDTTNGCWKVFYTDTEFTRTQWHRIAFVRNITFYKFAPAGGQPGKGFKQTMSKAITANPKLLILYPFVPYTQKIKAV